jgi:hypothetical protein
VKGEGNQQDYGMRIYDPRLGRFLSVDPITFEYPELTPYQFASNIPIAAIDVDGLEAGVKMPDGSIYVPYGRDRLGFKYPQGGELVGIAPPQSHEDFEETMSMSLDVIPVVGTGKGLYEAVSGKDMVSGKKLSWKDRLLGIIPFYKVGKKASVILDATKKIGKTETKVVKAAAMIQRLKEKVQGSASKKAQSESETEILPDQRNVLGDLRESMVANLTKGKVMKQGGRDYTESITTDKGKISASIDVISGNGNYITVGGPAKANKLGSWGDHLSRFKQIAEAKGVKALAYLDSSSPQELIEFTRKRLGNDNVFIIPQQNK